MLREYLKRVSKDAVAYGFGNVALSSISFFLVPIYTRIFSRAQYGVLDIIGTVSSFLSMFLLLSLSSAVFRFYHDHDESGKKDLVSTAFWYQLLAPLAFCSLASILSPSISTLLFRSERYSSFLAVSLMTVPFNSMMRMPITVMRLNFQKFRYNLVVLGQGLFQTLLTIVLVVFFKKGLMGVFVSGLVSAVLFSSFGLFLTRKYIGIRFSSKHFLLLLSFGLPMVPASVSRWIMGSADRMFLLKMTSLDEVGLYALGLKLVLPETFLFMAFQLAWSPIAYSIYRKPEAERVFGKVFLYFLLLSSALGMFLSLFSLEVLKVITRPAFYDANKVVGLLALGRILHAGFYLGSMGLAFANKMKYYALAVFAAAAANLLFNSVCVPLFGAMGAAAATAAAHGIEACLGYYWAKKAYPLALPFSKLGFMVLLYVPFVAVGLMVNRFLPHSAFLIKCGVVIAFLFLLSLLLEEDEKTMLRKWIQWGRGRRHRPPHPDGD